VQTNPK